MDEPKIYKNLEIPDQPFPQAEQGSFDTSSPSVKNVYGNTVIPEQPFPVKKYAQELISKTLNTMSMKINGAYSFLKQGAIQIGEHILGKSGDVKISPDGIVARNKNGDTTFALDGDTGDATFKGTLKAGTLIAGDDAVRIEESSGGGGRILLFNNGLPSIVIGDPN